MGMDKKLNLCKRTSSSSLSLNKMVLKYADNSFWPTGCSYAVAGSELNTKYLYFGKGENKMGVVEKGPELNTCPFYLTVSPEIPLPNFCQPSKVCPNSPGCTDVQCSAGCTGCTSLTLPLYLRVFSRIFNSFQLTVTSHRTTKKTYHVLRILHSHLQPLVHKPGLHHGLCGSRPRTDQSR